MWKDLTQDQKAEVMDLYLSEGITSLSQIRDFYDSALQDNTFSDGGKIYIKPENRGKFTALKERTGHSSTWFKEHGTPAQKKMATFALNARKWQHGLGGNLFDDGGAIYAGMLPEVTITGNNPNRNLEAIIPAGSGYMSPMPVNVDYSKIFGLFPYTINYLKNKLLHLTPSAFVDLSDKNVSRIKRDTQNVSSILTNDFVEEKGNIVRKKKDFVNTSDTLIGDKQIPLSKISTFYGIEDGKLKAGPLDIFKDETLVVPNRAKYVGKVKEYYAGTQDERTKILKENNDKIDSILNSYNEVHGYNPKLFGIIPTSPWKTLSRNIGRKKAGDIRRRLAKQNNIKFVPHADYVITENGDTVNNYNLNAYPKALFADEKGNAMFVARPHEHLKEINQRLKETPMYPIMVDNGRFYDYQLSNPNISSYSGLEDADDMFILGTVKSSGGPVINMFDDGGYLPRPVTTGGAGYIPDNYGNGAIDVIRKKLYDNIIPFGYNNPVKRVYNSVVKNKKEQYDPAYRVSDDTAETLDALWGQYLSIPEAERHSIDGSNGIVRSAGPNNKEYYQLKNLDPIIDEVVNTGLGWEERIQETPGVSPWITYKHPPLSIGDTVLSNTQNQVLGEYYIGRGYDNKGEYLSYQDTWDINPFQNTINQYGQDNPKEEGFIQKAIRTLTPKNGDASFGIGNPVNIFGKIYLDDIYGLSSPTHSYYLPEITVEGKNKYSYGGDKNDKTNTGRKEYIQGPIQQLARTFARKVIAPGYHYVTGNLINAGRQGIFMNDGFTLSNPSNLYDKYDMGGIPQSTYLMPREWQEDAFLKAGYIKGKEEDYGLVRKAVGNRNLPVYQTAKDAISRDKLIHIGNILSHQRAASENDLYHAGNYPTALYMDNNNNFYTKSWDLNDYGEAGYGGITNILTKGLDALGKPVVVTTGFQKVIQPESFSNDGIELNNSKHFLPYEYTDLLNKYMETKGLQKMYKIKGDVYNEKEYLNKYPDNYDEDSHTFLKKDIFYTLPEVVVKGKRK